MQQTFWNKGWKIKDKLGLNNFKYRTGHKNCFKKEYLYKFKWKYMDSTKAQEKARALNISQINLTTV